MADSISAPSEVSYTIPAYGDPWIISAPSEVSYTIPAYVATGVCMWDGTELVPLHVTIWNGVELV